MFWTNFIGVWHPQGYNVVVINTHGIFRSHGDKREEIEEEQVIASEVEKWTNIVAKDVTASILIGLSRQKNQKNGRMVTTKRGH